MFVNFGKMKKKASKLPQSFKDFKQSPDEKKTS